mgnify:CR=1 FL=1
MDDRINSLIPNIEKQVTDNRLRRREYLLLLSLMLFLFVPSVNQLAVDRIVSGMGSEILNIAGQIEWFDLFNETILAFLTVPLYFVFNKSKNENDLRSRIAQTFFLGLIIYVSVSVMIYFYANSLASYMDAPSESVTYLKLETIGFVLGFVNSFMYIVFVVKGRYTHITALLIAKVSMMCIGNVCLIPQYGIIGVAYTNICVNAIMSTISLYLLYKENLIAKWDGFSIEVLREWVRTGMFSGGQVFLANIVYMLIVIRMVNAVSSVGNYWLANNFIWGWLLIPIFAIGEMVKREYRNGYARIWNYLLLTTIVVIVWIVSIPLWGVMFGSIIRMENTDEVLSILYKLVPFYVAYAISAVFQGVLISVGRTDYLLLESAIVNIVYYGIVYGLFLAGVFETSMDFVILMFGFGMVVCMFLDIAFYLRSKKTVFKQSVSACDGVQRNH